MLVILAFVITPIFGCSYRVTEYHAHNDPMFKDLPNIDILNWDQSLMIFGNGFEVCNIFSRFMSYFQTFVLFQNPIVINYKGEICEPKIPGYPRDLQAMERVLELLSPNKMSYSDNQR